MQRDPHAFAKFRFDELASSFIIEFNSLRSCMFMFVSRFALSFLLAFMRANSLFLLFPSPSPVNLTASQGFFHSGVYTTKKFESYLKCLESTASTAMASSRSGLRTFVVLVNLFFAIASDAIVPLVQERVSESSEGVESSPLRVRILHNPNISLFSTNIHSSVIQSNKRFIQ